MQTQLCAISSYRQVAALSLWLTQAKSWTICYNHIFRLWCKQNNSFLPEGNNFQFLLAEVEHSTTRTTSFAIYYRT